MIRFFTRNTAPVQTAMLVQMIQMMQEYQREVLIPAMPTVPEQSEQVRLLQELGFTNAKAMQEHRRQMEQFESAVSARKSVKDYKEYVRESMETLFDARRRFGADTLLIRFDDFERLMKEFNLVCGMFKAYKGDVPLDKMTDIAALAKKMQYAPEYITTLHPITDVEIISRFNYDGIPDYICRFPFITGGGRWTWSYMDYHGIDAHNYDKGYDLKSSDVTNLFICAPAKDMEKLHKIVSFRRATDPFICAHTKYGVLVFTRWGEEANSTIVRKYEQLNEMINQRMVEG